MNDIQKLEFKALVEAGFVYAIYENKYQVAFPICDILLTFGPDFDGIYSMLVNAGENAAIPNEAIIAMVNVIEAAGLVSFPRLYSDALESLAGRVHVPTPEEKDLVTKFRLEFNDM